MKKILSVVIFALGIFVGSLSATTYYIDFDGGNDTQAGTSFSLPWKHCPGDIAATGKPAATNLGAGDTIIFKGGVYYRGTVGCNWSGTGGSRITYDGNTSNTFGTGRAIIDGSERLTNWTACTSAADAGGNTNWSHIYKITVSTTNNAFTVNMYENDQTLWPAQNPNLTDPRFPDDITTYIPIDPSMITSNSLIDTNAFVQSDPDYYNGCYLRLWGDPNVVRLLPITGYIPSEHKITFPENLVYTNITSYYALVNHSAFLDTPGEFVLSTNGTLYLWPSFGNPVSNEVTLSVRDKGLSIGGRSNLNIKGFRVQKTTGGASQWAGGSGIIDFNYGGSNITVSDNEVTRNYSEERVGAIKLTGSGTNVLIQNNIVYENPHNRGIIMDADDSCVRSNTLYRNGGTGIYLTSSHRSQVIANTVTEHPGTHANGISLYLGCEDCLVSYNWVSDGNIALTMQDATNNIVAYNVLHTADDASTAIIWSGDRISTNIYFYNNIMLNSFGNALGRSSTGSFNVVVRNNILDGNAFPVSSNSSHNVYTSLSGSQDSHNLGVGEIVQTNKNIVFVDPANRNFQLKTGSPAIDAGMDWGQIRDLVGNTKVGIAWDAGVYENQALLEITTGSSLTPGTAGKSYNQTMTAAGGQPPYAWGLASGSLPTGLGLTGGGVITGTPASVTSAVFNVRVTDNVATSVVSSFTLNIYAPLVIATTNLPASTAGVPYSTTLTASGGKAPYSWSMASGSLPSGLGLTSSGTITGTPDTVMITNFSIRVIDDAPVATTNAFSMTVGADTNNVALYARFDFGSTAYLTAGNWNNANSTNIGLVVTNAVDAYGVPRNIDLRLVTNAASLAFLTGPVNSNLYPSSAQRDSIASTKAFSYRIEGVNPSSKYSLTFFGSRNTATNALTRYTVGSSNVILDVGGNTTQTVAIDNIQPDANGWITFTVNTNAGSSSTYGYLSVLEVRKMLKTCTLTYVAGINGMISGAATQIVTEGSSGTAVTAVPDAGYHFVNWSDSSSTNPRTDINVTGDISVAANFAINTYTLTYTAGANGTISGTATQTVNQGSSGTAVLATANTGYHFVSWNDGVTANPRTDTGVTTDITVSANFAINTYTLTYAAGANGTVSGIATQTVNHGNNGSAVTAVANSGYNFLNWSDAVTNNPRTDVNVTNNISVTANFGQTSPEFWVTEYYLSTNQFTSTNYSLALNQPLASNYFILVRGSRTGDLTTNPDRTYVRVAAVPGGRGDLPDSGGNVVRLTRHSSGSGSVTWEGVVTVVECMNGGSAGGFRLLDIIDTSMTTTFGSDTSAIAWSNINQVVPFGGYRGGGAQFNETATSNIQGVAVYVRLYPSDSNTISWARDAADQTLKNASMTTFVVEWGSEWTVQYVNVAGTKGGAGANSTSEYTTATISSVARDHTWVWGAGTRTAAGIGNSSEGCIVTLGDGVNQNSYETKVAVGSEFTNAYNFSVYTMTHPKLVVDYQSTTGSTTVLDLPVTVNTFTNTHARFGWVYNSMNSTVPNHPRATFWSRFIDNSTVTISRGHNGSTFSAWVQAIDFAPLDQ